MRQEGVTDELECGEVEAEGWFTDRLLRSAGVAKAKNFLKAPPSQWLSRSSNVRPFHWLDTDPWLWADSNQAKQVQLIVGPTHQHSTILAERGSLGSLLVLIVVWRVTGRTAY